MESVGSPPRAGQVSKTASQNSGPKAASKTAEEALQVAENADAGADLAAAAPPPGNAGGGEAPPVRGHGLGQRVDIKV